MPSPSATLQLIRDTRRDEESFGDIRRGHGLFNPFELLPDPTQAFGKDPHFDLTGTGTVPAPTFLAGGGVLIASRTASAADNDAASLFPLATSAWGAVAGLTPTLGQETILEAMIRTGASLAETALIFGLKLTDTPVYATDNDQVLFVFDTDNLTLSPTNFTATPRWTALHSIAGVDTAFDTGITVVASTNYRLTIKIGTDGQARMYINGTLYRTTGVLTASAALLPYFAAVTRATATPKSHGIRWIRRWRTFN